MTLLFHDERCLEHQTSPAHPESPARVKTAYAKLVETGTAAKCAQRPVKSASREQIQRAHSEQMIDVAERLCNDGGGFLDNDTPVSEASFDVSLLASGAAVAAVDAVLKGEDSNAFCLMRPPGHHATPSKSMGFCLFNSIAVAAHHALAVHHLQRILIVDWDVHHGNGTQDIFYNDPRVMFFSAHRYPFYPGTGKAEETGAGRGQGYTVNLPVAFGTPVGEYRSRFATALSRAADKIRPELVLLSAGFDAHKRDPIGSLGLETEDFSELFKLVHQVADTHAHGALVSVLEGGYNVPILAECVDEHVKLLLANQHKEEKEQ